MSGPTALDVALLLLSLPATLPAAVLGGIILVPTTPETRERRWAFGFALAGAAGIAYHLTAAPEGWRAWIAPAIGLGIVARVLLERRAKASRAANARAAAPPTEQP